MRRTPNRAQILEANNRIRRGNTPLPTKLDEGYVALRIPTDDYKVLRVLFPDLESEDPQIRLKAWKALEASEVGDKYRVQERSPLQVKRSNNHGIIVK